MRFYLFAYMQMKNLLCLRYVSPSACPHIRSR